MNTTPESVKVELLPCPFCGAYEAPNWIMLAGHKKACMSCPQCEARGPIVNFVLQEEPIDVSTVPAEDAWNHRLEALSTRPAPAGDEVEPFQAKVKPWLMACFGAMIAGDREERNHRFLEEALELVQSLGCTADEAHQLVDYTYGRPIGHPPQEVGGVMVTLAALCLANDLDMHAAGWVELDRIWGKVEQIRAKQAAKPKYGPLPEAALPTPAGEG